MLPMAGWHQLQQWRNLPDCMLFSCCRPSTAGVEALPQLETLLAANNLFPDVAAVAPLAACKALQTLDLRDCKIASPDGLMEILKAPPHAPTPIILRGCRACAWSSTGI